MRASPPRLYGGTERIVSYLTEELVRLGHEVTLFASGDSVTSAELVPCVTRALRLDPSVRDTLPHFMLMIDKVHERAEEFDVLHFHIDLYHFPLFRPLAVRTMTTLHGRQDLGDLKPFYSRFGEMPLVSISNDQRKPLYTAEHALRLAGHDLRTALVMLKCGVSAKEAREQLRSANENTRVALRNAKNAHRKS